MVKKVETLLYVCFANKSRSPLLEAFTRVFAEQMGLDIEIGSAGTSEEYINEFYKNGNLSAYHKAAEMLSQENMIEIYNALSNHKVKLFTAELGEISDIILPVDNMNKKRVLDICPNIKNKVQLARAFANLDNEEIIDPVDPNYLGKECPVIYKNEIRKNTDKAYKLSVYECQDVAKNILIAYIRNWSRKKI